jgi:hypothetical protein
MEIDDLRKDMEDIGLPTRRKERQPDFRVKNATLKAIIIRAIGLVLLLIIMAFALLVVSHYKSPIMTLIVLVYLALGGYLVYNLFRLTYTGWLYTLFLSVAGIILPLLALYSKGTSNQGLTAVAVGIMLISLLSAALLWWVKDLFGIKKYGEIFVRYK